MLSDGERSSARRTANSTAAPTICRTPKRVRYWRISDTSDAHWYRVKPNVEAQRAAKPSDGATGYAAANSLNTLSSLKVSENGRRPCFDQAPSKSDMPIGIELATSVNM